MGRLKRRPSHNSPKCPKFRGSVSELGQQQVAQKERTALRRSLRNPIRGIDSQCPLLSKSGQNVAVPRMSAKCHKQTNAPQHERRKKKDRLSAVSPKFQFGV